VNIGNGIQDRQEGVRFSPSSLHQKQQRGTHVDGLLAAVFGVFFFGCMQESSKRALRDKKKWVIMFFVNLVNK